jgi:hypothetical protein
MTENEWLTTTDDLPLHRYLETLRHHRTKKGKRKFRLMACACVRRVWHLLSKKKGQPWLLWAEAIADDRKDIPEPPSPTQNDLRIDPNNLMQQADYAAYMIGCKYIGLAVGTGAGTASSVLFEEAYRAKRWGDPAYRLDKAGLLREVFGNPFQPITLELAWRTRTIQGLAQTAYDERILPAGTLDPERLGILADALEEAGCVAGVVQHLRSPGPHIRGCWAIDLLLGKQ